MASGTYDPAALPPGYKKTPPQEPGRRAMVVISDSPLTTRFSLTPALLRNAAGEFVAPTEESIRLAAADAKGTGVPGIVQPDPGAKVKGAYPLTSYTYAATVPGSLTEASAEAYAGALNYIASAGQELGDGPGQLPFGYVPLSDGERAVAKEAATEIVERVGEKPNPAPEPTTEPEPDSSEDPSMGGLPADTSTTDTTFTDTTYTDTTYTDTTVVDTTVTDTVVEETVVEETVVEETVVEEPPAQTVAVTSAATTALTPQSPVGAVRYLAVLLLIAGGTALLVAAVLMQRARATMTPAANPRRAPQERGAH